MKKWRMGFKLSAILLSFLLAFPANMVCAAASTAEVKHKASGDKYIPGFRINLAAEIIDEAGLLATRCYFKSKNDKNFAFVDMTHSSGDNYQATLPAPFVNSEEVNYLFVVVNKIKQVTRTQIFTLKEGETKEATSWKDINDVKEVRLDKAQDAAEQYVALYNKAKGNYAKQLPKYQTNTGDKALTVSTELSRSLVPLKGFYDAATVSEVAASAKYGFLAENLYTAEDIAAGGGSAATGGTTAGVAVATKGGLSTAAMIGIGVGVVAIGGIAAASGGGDSSSGGGTPATPVDPGTPVTPGDNTSLTTANLIGTSWSVSGIRADGQPRTGTVRFDSGGLFDYNFIDYGGIGSSTWSLSGSTLTMNFPSQWTGPVSGNTSSFTFNNAHGSYTFTRQ